jgi:hypothetical protein
VDRYRLGPLRDARTRDERVKRGDLAGAVDDARATADDVAVAEQRVAAVRAAIAGARTSGARDATGSQLVLAERFLARLRRDLDHAIAEHVRAEATHAGRLDQLELARGRLSRARADREVIERHFARWREQQRKLAERRAD